MYYPTKQEFIKYAKKGNLIPVYREIIGDMETPVAMFKRLNGDSPGYLLESVEGGEHLGRYSFLGVGPSKKTNSLDELKKIMSGYKPVAIKGLPRFSGGAVGYIGYNVISLFEDIPQKNPSDLGMPSVYFMITDTLIIFDHVKHVVKIVTNALVDKEPAKVYNEAIKKIEGLVSRIKRHKPPAMVELPREIPRLKVNSNLSKIEFENMVVKAKEYIRAGDIIQVVLSQRFNAKINCDPFNIYRALRSVNPSPYMYYLKGDDFHIIGSSPELLVRCEEGVVETRPIAGTRPRGLTEVEDQRLEHELISNTKERAEHIMLVDLGRNDIGRVCQSGTVKVTDFMIIERYSHVMHIVSNVVGKLRKDKDQFDVLISTFPAGTVTGAPKIRAMEIIDELENLDRGPYAGAIGYFSFSGNLDSAITIRTVVVKGDTAYIQAGAGIVADSVPSREYQETVNKAKGMIRAIELAETF